MGRHVFAQARAKRNWAGSEFQSLRRSRVELAERAPGWLEIAFREREREKNHPRSCPLPRDGIAPRAAPLIEVAPAGDAAGDGVLGQEQEPRLPEDGRGAPACGGLTPPPPPSQHASRGRLNRRLCVEARRWRSEPHAQSIVHDHTGSKATHDVNPTIGRPTPSPSLSHAQQYSHPPPTAPFHAAATTPLHGPLPCAAATKILSHPPLA